MILKVTVLVDVDTTDTDIEDMREEIAVAASNILASYDGDFEIEPGDETTIDPPVDFDTLERYEQIAKDIKKEFHYEKSTGLWHWSDRDKEFWSDDFNSRFDALKDAVEPYVTPSE